MAKGLVFSSGLMGGVKDQYGSNIPSPIPNPTLSAGTISTTPTPRRIPSNLSLIPLNSSRVETVIRAFLSSREPVLQRVLLRAWGEMRKELTYKDIEEAMRNGGLELDQLQALQDAYVELINEKLAPEWAKGFSASSRYMADEVQSKLGTLIRFDDRATSIRTWISNRGGELAVGLSNQQHTALKGFLNYAINERPMGPREASRYMRAVIGLTPAQTKAIQTHRNKLLDGGMSPGDVDKQVFNYATRLHTVRAERIARTEMSFAFNQGALEQMRQAVKGPLAGAVMVKEWYTAEDERVCPHCGPLHGQLVDLEQTFPGATTRLPNTYTAPAHPGCRCAIIYNLLE